MVQATPGHSTLRFTLPSRVDRVGSLVVGWALLTGLSACQPLNISSGSPTPTSPSTLAARETRMPTSPPDPQDPQPMPTATEAHAPAQSPDADVLFVRAELSQDSTWTFHVTIHHPDTGWEDYADGWDVITPSGEVLKPDPDAPFTRLLLHPHVDEQPFTRSQSSIHIPEGIRQIEVRAHDLVTGFGGRTVTVDLDLDSGPDFSVIR